jgi:hypothetical protein
LDRRRIYAVPARLKLNHWALSGDLTVGKQAIVLNKATGRIAYRLHARDLHLVMGPAARGASVRFRVRIEGLPPGAAHGMDVGVQSKGTVTQPRLYQLIRQPKPIAERQFEIEFSIRAWRLLRSPSADPWHSTYSAQPWNPFFIYAPDVLICLTRTSERSCRNACRIRNGSTFLRWNNQD